MPGLQRRLFDLLSQDIGKASLLTGDFTADQRVAAFLISLSRRLAVRGFSSTRFVLTMTRSDIASYLRLAPETVSRVFRRFADERLVRVERKSLHLLKPEALLELASDVLRERQSLPRRDTS